MESVRRLFLHGFEALGESPRELVVQVNTSYPQKLERHAPLVDATARGTHVEVWMLGRSMGRLSLDTWLSCAVCYQHDPMTPTLVFCFDKTQAADPMGVHEAWWRRVAQDVDVRYGFAYERRFGNGPTALAMGMEIRTLPPHLDVEYSYSTIEKWCFDRQGDPTRAFQHLHRKLWTVFPMNWLNAAHLRLPVGALNLEDWIAGDPSRGTLQKFSTDAALWRVPQRDRPGVAAALSRAGLLLNPTGEPALH